MILNCEVMVTHFLYLGMSVGGVIRKMCFGVGWLKNYRLDYVGGNVAFC